MKPTILFEVRIPIDDEEIIRRCFNFATRFISDENKKRIYKIKETRGQKFLFILQVFDKWAQGKLAEKEIFEEENEDFTKKD